MDLLPLTSEERGASGFTHKAIITYADVAALALATTVAGAITLKAYTAGQILGPAAARVVTVFSDGAATLSSLTMAVGWNGGTTDDADGLIDEFEMEATGTEVFYTTTSGAAFTTQPKGYAAKDDGNIEATFVPTGANSSTLTSGEVHIFLTIVDLTKF